MKTSSNPKISVVMSVYNGLPYLREAVKSILNQTYKNFEFIIIDDASKDDSWNYLRSLKNKRVKLIRNKKNLGLATSLNKALKVSKGDFIARMDADDISLPERLEVQLRFMVRHPGIDVCGTWVEKIDESGQVIGEVKFPTNDPGIKRLLAWQPAIVHPTFMAKSIFFKKLNYYNPKFDFAEEYELLMRAKNKFKMANIPKKLLLWRFGKQRRSRTSWDRMENVDYIIKSEALKRGDFGPLYFLIVGLKFFITFVLPYDLKLKTFKFFKTI